MSESLQENKAHGCVFYRVSPVQWFHPPAPREYGFYPLVSYGSFDCLAPDKSIFVGFRLDSTVDILHIKADEAFIGKDKNQLGKYIIYFLLYTVTKTVDSDKIRMLTPASQI